ncbi:S-layer homology domain-containing protein [Paenibacillus sp. TAF58]
MGGTVHGDTIEVTSNHLTKFAVLNVESKAEQPVLSDISNYWVAADIQAAVKAGIVHGYEDGSFRPGTELTRAQLAVMLADALGASAKDGVQPNFADNADIPVWALSSAAVVQEKGLMQGYEGNALPQAKRRRVPKRLW